MKNLKISKCLKPTELKPSTSMQQFLGEFYHTYAYVELRRHGTTT